MSCGANDDPIRKLCEDATDHCLKTCRYRNVALQGTATQSSLYENCMASNAIDDNLDSHLHHGSCSTTKNEFAPWWRVNLLRSHKINQVRITNRNDCCGERLNGAEILIGNSLENNGNNNPRCGNISNVPPLITQTFHCNDMVGQYVNIVIPGRREHLQLCEVQVFGVPTYEDDYCLS
ncbi:fucolectin-like [Discoglossus pictus]